MSNSTMFLTVFAIIAFTVYLTRSTPVIVSTTPPVPVEQEAPVQIVVPPMHVVVPVALPAAPKPIQRYVRMPNGALIPIGSESAQEFEQKNTGSANDPLAPPHASNHHSTDDLINSVNKDGL